MNEPMLHYITQAYIHSDDVAHDGEKGCLSYALRIENMAVSNEHLGKLMEILLGAGRTSDAKKAATDRSERMRLYKEFGID